MSEEEAIIELDKTLEPLIDAHGLILMLDSIEAICRDKAEYWRMNQDVPDPDLWHLWAHASEAVGRAASKIEMAKKVVGLKTRI